MSGPHGLPGAVAVTSASVRRALVLVGLLAGAVGAIWLLGASSAQADEVAPVGGTVEQAGALGGPGDAPPVEEAAAQPAEALLDGEPEGAGAAVRGESTTRATPRAVPDGARGHERRCLVGDYVAYPADESVAEIRGL